MIKAKIQSEDLVYIVNFDATAWFDKASSTDLVKLIMCNFNGRPAAKAALFFKNIEGEIEVIFNYCHRVKLGVECIINEDDARKWLKDNKGRKYFSDLLTSAIIRMA
jgi:hypothetical protein|tara:strand:- start:79 stop:399 length:321 start_codon:yes stop_codon:yes gene_type:complete